MISLILDTDIGDDVDDAFALAFAARHPQIRLCAVTTVLGDTRWRAALALRLLDELGVDGVPVAAGEPSAGIDGITLSGDVVVPLGSNDRRIDPRSVTDLMADAIAAAPEPVWLATIGPATNAAALLAERPEALDRLAGVVMMGGRHDLANSREHNFGTDPTAAAVVCNCGLPVRCGRLPRHVPSAAGAGRPVPRATRPRHRRLAAPDARDLPGPARSGMDQHVRPRGAHSGLGRGLSAPRSDASARRGFGRSGSIRGGEPGFPIAPRRVDQRWGLPSPTARCHRPRRMNLPPNPGLAPDSPQFQLIETAHAVLERDARVVAAWIGGSIAAGTADCWSDVDLRLAVEEADLPAVITAVPGDAGGDPSGAWMVQPARSRRASRCRHLRGAAARRPGDCHAGGPARASARGGGAPDRPGRASRAVCRHFLRNPLKKRLAGRGGAYAHR